MNALITDYFAVEPLIVDRIKNALPELKAVYTPFQVGDMMELSQVSPCAHVIWRGDGVNTAQGAGKGVVVPVDQRWLVVLAIRHAGAQLQNTTILRSNAGVLIPTLLGALQGWQPVNWMRPLERVPGPPAGNSPTFGYFPFLFSGRIIT
jgi:hypothetical protein